MLLAKGWLCQISVTVLSCGEKSSISLVCELEIIYEHFINFLQPRYAISMHTNQAVSVPLWVLPDLYSE